MVPKSWNWLAKNLKWQYFDKKFGLGFKSGKTLSIIFSSRLEIKVPKPILPLIPRQIRTPPVTPPTPQGSIIGRPANPLVKEKWVQEGGQKTYKNSSTENLGLVGPGTAFCWRCRKSCGPKKDPEKPVFGETRGGIFGDLKQKPLEKYFVRNSRNFQFQTFNDWVSRNSVNFNFSRHIWPYLANLTTYAWPHRVIRKVWEPRKCRD